MLMALVMCLGLVCTSAWAIDPGDPVVEEYHFMYRNEMNAYFLSWSSYDGASKLGRYYVERMWLEAGDKHTPEAVGIDVGRDMYNQTAKLVNDGTYHIQPNEVTAVKVAFAYWYKDGWAWKLQRETLTLAYDEFTEMSYGENFVELYVKGSPSIPDPETATVTFDTNGGSTVDPQEIVVGETAEQPADPTKEGFTFVQWVDAENTPFDFETPITEDITLYAVWTPKQPIGAVLEVTKTVDNSSAAQPGDERVFTIKVKNTGDEIAREVVVKDLYPVAQLNAVSETTSNGKPAVDFGGSMSWQAGDVAPGESVTMVVTMKVSSQAEAGTVTNTASAEAENAVTATGSVSIEIEEATPVKGAVLEVTKTVDNSSAAQPGDERVFTIKVKNTGDEIAREVVVKDLYPVAQLNAVSETTSNGKPAVDFGGSMSWQAGDVAPGESVTMVVTMKVSSQAEAGTVTNTASAEAKNAVTATGSVSIEVIAETEPVEPTDPNAPTPDALNALLDVVVDCTTNADHADKTYTTLLADSYEVSEVKDSACTVTIQAAPYVADYGNNHTLSDSASKTVNLLYDNGWKLADSSAPATVTFTVICSSDPGTTDPGTTDPGTTDPGTTNPPYTGGGDDDGDDDITVVINPGRTPTTSTPETSEEPTEIPEPSTPMTDLPEDSGEDIPDDNDVPLGDQPDEPTDPGKEIPDGNVPMSDLPQTGAVAAPVNPATTASLVALAFSMAGCGLYFTFGRKKGEEEE